MKQLRILVAVALAGLGAVPGSVQAATDTAAATVSVSLPLNTAVTFTRDVNSSTRGTASTILFDLRDSDDIGVTSPNPGFAYAPYRSETGKNWHLVTISATGSTMTLSAGVSGTVGAIPMADKLDVFFGGFFDSNGNPKGGQSTDWELLDGNSRSLPEPFIGIMPANYRLRLDQVPAGAHTGLVTWTLVST